LDPLVPNQMRYQAALHSEFVLSAEGELSFHELSTRAKYLAYVLCQSGGPRTRIFLLPKQVDVHLSPHSDTAHNAKNLFYHKLGSSGRIRTYVAPVQSRVHSTLPPKIFWTCAKYRPWTSLFARACYHYTTQCILDFALGIEPRSPRINGGVLPLHYTRYLESTEGIEPITHSGCS
jgi:hypothetical protein